MVAIMERKTITQALQLRGEVFGGVNQYREAFRRLGRPVWSCARGIICNGGFGKKILRFSEARALSLKRQVIKVSVETFNKPAISLYEKTGFTRTSEASGYICYTKVLPKGNKRKSQKQC